MAVVGRRFKLSRQRDNLGSHHHEEVRALSFQAPDRRLDRAADNHRSKRGPRLRVHEPTREESGRADHHLPRLIVELDREQRRPGLGEWVVCCLVQLPERRYPSR
jgi:hypothetical protein